MQEFKAIDFDQLKEMESEALKYVNLKRLRRSIIDLQSSQKFYTELQTAKRGAIQIMQEAIQIMQEAIQEKARSNTRKGEKQYKKRQEAIQVVQEEIQEKKRKTESDKELIETQKINEGEDSKEEIERCQRAIEEINKPINMMKRQINKLVNMEQIIQKEIKRRQEARKDKRSWRKGIKKMLGNLTLLLPGGVERLRSIEQELEEDKKEMEEAEKSDGHEESEKEGQELEEEEKKSHESEESEKEGSIQEGEKNRNDDGSKRPASSLLLHNYTKEDKEGRQGQKNMPGRASTFGPVLKYYRDNPSKNPYTSRISIAKQYHAEPPKLITKSNTATKKRKQQSKQKIKMLKKIYGGATR